MKIKFIGEPIVAGERKRTIIDMILKGEKKRYENGEDFELIYQENGKVKIFITKKGCWASALAYIKKGKLKRGLGLRLSER
jgi:hypothetical protein